MQQIKVSTVQFEHRSGDKEYNLSVIDKFSQKAATEGSKIVAFHECSITGYSFASKLSKEQLLEIAELIPERALMPEVEYASESESVNRLIEMASKHNVVILAGLFEKDRAGDLYNTYVCVEGDGLVAKHRKIHPFIHPSLKAGDRYSVFELFGWKCGMLTCYDNNIVENVRATALLGAQIIFMPHVTMCTPSSRPGAGFIDPRLWENREADPTSLRLEFDGMKGRGWLMKWLPSRAYDNAVYAVFSNPVGMDDQQLKNGCSMIIDPFGDILDECRMLGDDMATATLTPDKLTQAGGHRYMQARRPERYGEIIGKPHQATQKVAWLT